MKTRHFLPVLAALAALAARASDDVQVTYRGRLQAAGAAPAAQTLAMEFRLYADKGSATPSWTMSTNVLVDAQGLFQVALRGDGLAEAIDEGRARWIGVSIAGGKEQYPRQELLAAPQASKAALAGSLADSPRIGEASAGSVRADSLSTGTISVAGAASVPTESPLPMSVSAEGDWAGSTLPARGDVRFFGRAEPRVLDARPASGGGCSFGAADCNCAAYLTTLGLDLPGVTLLFKQGEEIAVPAAAGLPNGTTVHCFVYPVGVE